MDQSNQGNNQSQWSEWSSASSASNRELEFAARQRYNAQPQHGLNAAAMPNNHHDYIFPRYADHTYRDFSTYIKEGNRIEKHKKSDRNFPARLHAILSDEQYAHIISWMPHGRAWKVIDKELLMQEAAPKFFGQSKYASFARQLSGWGFKRLHQTGPDFGCYYHECFLRGHPKLTALMRRVSPGQGKVTPNMHAEPDFYTIAEQYPLEPPADVTEKVNPRPLKVVKAPISGSGRQKSDRPSDFDVGDEALGDKDDDDPLLTRKAAAPSMEHQWDPFDQEVDSGHFRSHHPDAEATAASAMDHYAGNGNSANHLFTERSSRSQSFASMDGTKGTAETSAQEGMKYNPFPESYQQSGSYRDRGYSDPFPQPNHHMGHHSRNRCPMHQAQQEYYGSNVNQYASQQQYAGGYYYYYPPPRHLQTPQHDVYRYSHDNMRNHYWYRNPYCHSYGAQEMTCAQGYAQAQAANPVQPQPHYPAQDQGNHGHGSSPRPQPTFSPVMSFQGIEEESDSKPKS